MWLFETITLERKKPKALNTIIMPIIQNNVKVNLKMNNFLSLISTRATCWKELYTLASNCPRGFSCPSWKIKTNSHLISINTFKNLFSILPLSLKIVNNLCLLNSKQETACQILTTARSLVTQVVFFLHMSIIFRHVSLINTETSNLKQFWICVKFSQVWPLKLDETVCLSYFKQAAQRQFIWFTQ